MSFFLRKIMNEWFLWIMKLLRYAWIEAEKINCNARSWNFFHLTSDRSWLRVLYNNMQLSVSKLDWKYTIWMDRWMFVPISLFNLLQDFFPIEKEPFSNQNLFSETEIPTFLCFMYAFSCFSFAGFNSHLESQA